MKYCVKCGNAMAEEAAFCTACGAPAAVAAPAPAQETPGTDDGLAKEKEFLDTYHRLFRYERLAWKIAGIVLLILSLLFIGLGMLFLLLALVSRGAALIVPAVMLVLYGLLFLPAAILNLKMVPKAQYYMDILYTDVRPVITRCSSIGMFILAGFFNEIALIFIIINFVRTKANREMLQRVTVRQQNYRG